MHWPHVAGVSLVLQSVLRTGTALGLLPLIKIAYLSLQLADDWPVYDVLA